MYVFIYLYLLYLSQNAAYRKYLVPVARRGSGRASISIANELSDA